MRKWRLATPLNRFTIKPVLHLLKTERYPIPAYVEYEYAGGPSSQEVAKGIEYIRMALA